ncbi:double-strand break repair helicase AddA [Sphingomonas sp. CGMCC 1.13654]|uniref:DNA 3'-5' helicase n=1 Tax=Sphingomonas chungangi TaxID=2683589 RepID=A0A838LAP3_9SPHN|nr:double-strand break repair helicase AddA [Sphingomonas chungangi]MBA2936274.1 double-strand break repair helicase AddA [Sphingomonas chungangi]MVW55659.1 double-strand break repair helicase AddA [Sphingomonas chungangi]
MSRRPSLLKPLEGAQAEASDPRRLVWLSASAGTGKTHVLTARVIRLLLAGNDPAAILCLTFTKAGAAEMADRIHARLASWVRMKQADLRKELFALGEPNDDEAIAEARTLFARVLEATGGGLRIQTIHAFCQTLLAGFPSEAGLIPGFRPLEEREEQALAHATLAQMLVEAERGGDLPLIRDIQVMSRRLGEQGAESFLRQCARSAEAMAALGPGIEAKLRRAMGVPDGDVEEAIEEACGDGHFDRRTLERVSAALAGWGTKGALASADTIAAWLAASPARRAETLDDLHLVWAKKDGELRSFAKGKAPPDPSYPDDATRMFDLCGGLLALRAKAAFAALLAAGLRAGQAYARAYAEAKRAAGAVDFEDLIRKAVRLLGTPGMGEWVRYKLDQRTDHILVDEAQDTNVHQWSIVAALAGEFFAGEGAKEGVLRTIFTVGDFKQAIFGFQGTNPLAFEAAERHFSARAEGGQRSFRRLSLDRSFRSTPPVLAVVDKLIGHLGAAALGLADEVPPHEAAKKGAGRVLLWPPVIAVEAEEVAAGEEGWLDDATRLFADRLARQVKAWIDAKPWMATKDRPLRPEDIMILVRKRGELASLLVARLHAHGVPVAGVDRLSLGAPLAVKDLLAAARFALQPADDLNLAGLLVSPLLGLSQLDLYDIGHGRPGTLWAALPEGETRETLGRILAAVDLVTPYRFFEEMLSGPLQGRRKLLRRLGEEARDPIEELLNAALLFEENGTPSLQLFLDWFDRGEVQIKRDPSAPLDAVRVMTAHGSKGLQAPLVVLADATGDPDRSPGGGIGWSHEEGGEAVPVIRPKKEERFAPFADLIEEAERRDLEEHWRLLYVAATRAEEWLAIGGALGPGARGVIPANSWYAALDAALDGLESAEAGDALWGKVRAHGREAVRGRERPPRAASVESAPPAWLHAPAPEEARPPRPLAPSSIGIDTIANPPPGAKMREAAERGRLLHALFERLPDLASEARAGAADRWLMQSAGVSDPALRSALIRDALAVIEDPRFGAIFSSAALAEAPIAAVVGGEVIAGTVDRLLVTDDKVMVIDFKTGRRASAALGRVPEHHLDQMGAYAAALAAIFPGRAIEAALLYTAGPTLIIVPPEVLADHKPGL